MSDTDFINWEMPSGDDAFLGQFLADFHTNFALAFEYYLQQGAAELGGYLMPGDLEPVSLAEPYTIQELSDQLAMEPRYEKASEAVNNINLVATETTTEQMRELMAPYSTIGELAEAYYRTFIEEKLVDEAAATRNPANVGGAADEVDPSEIEEGETDLFVEDEEAKAAEDLARQKAEQEAQQIVGTIDDLQSAVFNENIFVQSSLINLIDLKLNVVDFYEPKAYAYTAGSPNACIMVTGDPFNFQNRLAVYPDNDLYFNLSSAELGNLQPKIRLYKTIQDPETKEIVNVPIHFDTSFTERDLESLLVNKQRRAVGAGIKSFSVDFTGVDEFSMHKSFSAKLKIYAASMSELIKPRLDARTGVTYSYIELALAAKPGMKKPGRNIRDLENQMLDTDNGIFEIKAQIGISQMSAVSAANTDYANALMHNSVTFTMNAVKYNINYLSANGAVELEIEYLPYIETKFATDDFNVLTDRKLIEHRITTEMAEIWERTTCSDAKKKTIKKRIETEKKLVKRAAADLIRELGAAKKIRYLPLDASIVQQWMELGPALDWGKLTKLAPYAAFVGKEGNQEALKKDIEKAATDESKEYRGPIKNSFTTPLTQAARFVYLADLVDMLLAKMTKANAMSQIKPIIEKITSAKMADIKKQEQIAEQAASRGHVYRAAASNPANQGLQSQLEADEQELLDKYRAAMRLSEQSGDNSLFETFTTEERARAMELWVRSGSGANDAADELAERQAQRAEGLASDAAAAAQYPDDDFEPSKLMQDYPAAIDQMLARYKRSSDDFSNMRVVFGPIEIIDPADPNGNVRIVSIGDLPIPIPLLLEYMVKMAAERGIRIFDFSRFIKDLVTNTINNWLNDDLAFNGALRQGTRIDSTEIRAYDSHFKTDDLTALLVKTNEKLKRASPGMAVRQSGDAAPSVSNIKTISAHRLYTDDLPQPAVVTATSKGLEDTSTADETSFLVFFSKPACPVRKGFGDIFTDGQNGIHHYILGKDKGIVKDIKLEAAKDAGGIKATRFHQSGDAGAAALKEVFNARIRTYANLNLWPGTMLYIDPRGWVPDMDPETRDIYGSVNALDDLGLGGYYVVNNLSHVFESGRFETEIFARWEWNVEETPLHEDEAEQSPSAKPLSKCGGEDSKPKKKKGPCHGGSEARMKALDGLYGIEKVARSILQENGDFGDEPNPSSNPD